MPAQPMSDTRTPASERALSPPVPQRTFFFVNEESSSKGKRAHVMKHHIQEKKKERRKLLAQATAGPGGRETRGLHWTRKVEPSQGAAARVSSSSKKDSVARSKLRRDADDFRIPDLITCSLCRHLNLSPNRSDPFDTLPLSLTDESQQLVDCWTKKLSYWSGQNVHMKIAAFQQAMLHPMTFHVMILTYCARLRARVLGVRNTPQSFQYIATAERALSRYIEKTNNPYDENVIMAFSALSLQEERYGDKVKAAEHLHQAMLRLRPRTGMYFFQDVFVHYVRYTMGPREVIGSPEDVHRLMSFLRSAEFAAKYCHPVTPSDLRMSAFQFGSTFHMLLSSGPRPSHVPDEERRWVVKYGSIHDLCRISSLIYITLSLMHYRNSPHMCNRFLQNALTKVNSHRLDHWPSTETLVWMLLEDPFDADLKDPHRAWIVGDLMESVQKLPQELNFQFSELLLRFLMMRPLDLEISVEKFEANLWAFLDLQKRELRSNTHSTVETD
ncbi:hypothetical protein LOZ12_004691 [Ophidiomyces ophidiicola]|uniref:Uncharacterized protein n=1 Tax=Ophidiomyces ophidiicola TaxID=1387563 RepID=A0ACB8USP9_9EURO|nr:uncharacterized protein LOZ57_006521 [Ophidiomyces ophidiicola]KAI1910332.1 hypothetical protein LOZ64_005007 [Ophidiomyces ophidiicola]KAI1913751.1 hypothetical protein LOZ61_002637 [Ophidiomyces ophidiicola]KAI1928624.1 hypothetical protein LOZ60_002173 [Ophidiomyces ophidiicola]KAI1937840.1 hypothetical protein LOZ57_006521 [Ophidiomyces ophidiicola]KAI1942374.1 hypothetical protein LOZ62_004595 [Ophidiomyces ophidiicola]